MAGSPRNVRTKRPRPLAVRAQARAADQRYAYRWSAAGAGTPTPPPVTVSVPPPSRSEQPRDDELALAPAEPEQRSNPRLGLWILLPLLVAACVGTAIAYRSVKANAVAATRLGAAANLGAPQAQPPSLPLAASAASTSSVSSGWAIKHDGHVPLDGGVLVAPKTFSSSDGSYDLIIHFHGDVEIVRASVQRAKVNTMVAIINLGVGSEAYREQFQATGRFEALLAQIQRGVAQRGVAKPVLRRLALTAWSAGYGSIESILENRQAPHADRDPLDAILILDGLHCGFVDGDSRRLKRRSVRSFIRAARAAAEGQLMFSLTHSEIDPRRYASTKRTATLILDSVGAKVKSSPLLPMPEHIQLTSVNGIAPERNARMMPTSDTRVGLLRVQGFKGDTKAHHAGHLTQMAAIGLPDLAERWSKPPSRARAD